eukprot:TRINITY_DN100982_c0_g1_i1.p1 TRINITY_DN100982_c0_g1~~TRINITY_DN100982_c0_g1_i1.p1  ORF type:complete len:202 (-),score=35.14 TRINITY_DN100982_c0_g1_i1:20-625(-)
MADADCSATSGVAQSAASDTSSERAEITSAAEPVRAGTGEPEEECSHVAEVEGATEQEVEEWRSERRESSRRRAEAEIDGVDEDDEDVAPGRKRRGKREELTPARNNIIDWVFNDLTYVGNITKWFAASNYGFIRELSTQTEVFFHFSRLLELPTISGAVVAFEMSKSSNGRVTAINVRPSSFAIIHGLSADDATVIKATR